MNPEYIYLTYPLMTFQLHHHVTVLSPVSKWTLQSWMVGQWLHRKDRPGRLWSEAELEKFSRPHHSRFPFPPSSPSTLDSTIVCFSPSSPLIPSASSSPSRLFFIIPIGSRHHVDRFPIYCAFPAHRPTRAPG